MLCVCLGSEMLEQKFVFPCLRVVVSELLSQGVNASCTDRKMRSSLHIAAAAGNEQIGQHMLDI